MLICRVRAILAGIAPNGRLHPPTGPEGAILHSSAEISPSATQTKEFSPPILRRKVASAPDSWVAAWAAELEVYGLESRPGNRPGCQGSSPRPGYGKPIQAWLAPSLGEPPGCSPSFLPCRPPPR